MTSATSSHWWYPSRLSPLPEVLEDDDDDEDNSEAMVAIDKSAQDDFIGIDDSDDYGRDNGGGRATLSQMWRKKKKQQELSELSSPSSETAAEAAREKERQKALAIDSEVRALALAASKSFAVRGQNGSDSSKKKKNEEQEERSVDEHYETVVQKRVARADQQQKKASLTSPPSRKDHRHKRSPKTDQVLTEGPSVSQIRSRFEESCLTTTERASSSKQILKTGSTLQVPSETRKQNNGIFYSYPVIVTDTLDANKDTDVENLKFHPLLYKLYDVPTIESSISKDVFFSSSSSDMSGYLERLPRDRRRSMLGSDWRRQYFVAEKGYLQSYEDDTKSVPLERTELFNGKVQVLNERRDIIGVEDRNGHFIALRCVGDEGEDNSSLVNQWERAIRTNINLDFSQSFVSPSPLLSQFSKTIVIDIGGASVRAGVATAAPTLPQLFFPSVVATTDNDSRKCFGFDALADEVRSGSTLTHPFAPSKLIDKRSIDTVSLQGILRKVFQTLSVEPNQYDIQLSLPHTLNERTMNAVAKILFDDFGVSSVYMGHQTLFALHSYNARSGIMVDMGERVDVVPVEEGYIVPLGVSQLSVGGRELRAKLQNCLLGRNYSLTSVMDGFVVRYAMENLLYVADDLGLELKRCKELKRRIDIVPAYGASSLERLELGTECFEVSEGLFKPSLMGLDQAGIHLLVQKAIKECSIDARREMSQSIFLSGGLTMIPGFKERLERKLESVAKVVRPRVHAAPHRYHAAFLGAMEHASSQTFQKVKVTKQRWVKGGASFTM